MNNLNLTGSKGPNSSRNVFWYSIPFCYLRIPHIDNILLMKRYPINTLDKARIPVPYTHRRGDYLSGAEESSEADFPMPDETDEIDTIESRKARYLR